MILTVIVPDSAVYKNGLCYLNLNISNCGIPLDVRALQWQGSSGWIEFTGGKENKQITELPDWAYACVDKWDEADYEEKNPPAPTPEEIISRNEHSAKKLLTDSDWTQLPDVSLANKEDWETYRSALREIATNPTLDPIWPVEPPVIWQL